MPYGCRIADSDFPAHFLSEVKQLSDHPVLEVNTRMKGITRGRSGKCYWNANILSQTFGGHPLYGWMITDLMMPEIEGDPNSIKPSGSLRVIGHACWITPEGNLVNVTANKGDKIYFLPSPETKLVLNGKVNEYLKNFVYAKSLDDLCVDMTCIFDKEDYGNVIFSRNQNPKDYLNRLITSSFVMPKSLIEQLFDEFHTQGIRISSDDFVEAFAARLFTVNEVTSLIDTVNPTYNLLHLIFEAVKKKKSMGESYPNLHDNSFSMIDDVQDATWRGIIYDGNESLAGVSTATGKPITEYQPRQELLEEHQVPRQKKRRRKIERTAQKFNLTPQEICLLSNPYYYPHPSIVEKAGGVRIPRVA